MPEPDLEALADTIRRSVRTFEQLDAAVGRATEWSLHDMTAPTGLPEAIRKLLVWLNSKSRLDLVDQILAAVEPVAFDHQVLDLVHFDLAAIEDAFHDEWVNRNWPPFVGARIVTTSAVLPKVRRRLADIIDAVDPRDPWPLDPAIRTPAQLVDLFDRARAADRELVVSVEVASTVDGTVIDDVWQQMAAATVGRAKPMLVLFSAEVDLAFPADLIALPSPRFCRNELDKWVVRVGKALGWQPECRRSVTSKIWDEIAGSADEVDPFVLYDTLQAHSEEIQADPEAFRARLCA